MVMPCTVMPRIAYIFEVPQRCMSAGFVWPSLFIYIYIILYNILYIYILYYILYNILYIYMMYIYIYVMYDKD